MPYKKLRLFQEPSKSELELTVTLLEKEEKPAVPLEKPTSRKSWKKMPYEDEVGRDISYFRRVGVAAPEVWYTSPQTGTALTTGAPTANFLRAIPFMVAKQITIDTIAINVTTSVTGNARLGINKDNGNLYPGNRVIDAGEISTTPAGVKALTINITLEANTLYWLVIVSSAAPTIRCFSVGSLVTMLGLRSALDTLPCLGYYVSYTYAALPATFPTGAYPITAVPIPAIFVRLAA